MFIGTNQINVAHPQRIISLVPSISELLFDLGLEKETAGITKFCIHPRHWHEQKPRIGGTKSLHIDNIRALQPDLIIANKEENTKEQIELLAHEFPVWLTDVKNISDALEMIRDIGRLTGKTEAAEDMISQINIKRSTLPISTNHIPTAYLIWKDPYMTVGADTYIHDMLRLAGCHNIFGQKTRYPSIEIKDLLNNDCRLILLSSEPYPFREKHMHELSAAVPGARVILADGEMFSWYGSRLLKALDYLKDLNRRILVYGV